LERCHSFIGTHGEKGKRGHGLGEEIANERHNDNHKEKADEDTTAVYEAQPRPDKA